MEKKLRKSKMVAIKVMWFSSLFEKEEKKINFKSQKKWTKKTRRDLKYMPWLMQLMNLDLHYLFACFFFYGKYSLLRLFPIILPPS